jgi:exodeoxyribonuclease VII large subunit
MRLQKAIRQRLTTNGVRNDHLRQRLVMQSPRRQLSDSQDALRRVSERLVSVMQQDLKQRRETLGHAAQTLNVVSPLATLGRGYSIVRDSDGNILRDASNVNPGDTISARVARGEMTAKVTSVKSAEETGP